MCPLFENVQDTLRSARPPETCRNRLDDIDPRDALCSRIAS